MSNWHNESDTDDQLKDDVREIGHTPDSVRDSAKEELRKRGYSESEIDYLRLR